MDAPRHEISAARLLYSALIMVIIPLAMEKGGVLAQAETPTLHPQLPHASRCVHRPCFRHLPSLLAVFPVISDLQMRVGTG